MALPTFDFTLSLPAGDTLQREVLVSQAADGALFTKVLHANRVMHIEGVVQFPNVNEDLTYDDLLDVEEEAAGGFLLAKATIIHNRKKKDAALGTAVGGSGQQFAFAQRYIDPESLAVAVSGVAVASGASTWTLQGNTLESGAEPYVLSGSGFPAGEVTATYEFYYRVRLDGPIQTEIQVPSLDIDYPGTHSVSVSFTEAAPGDHRVS